MDKKPERHKPVEAMIMQSSTGRYGMSSPIGDTDLFEERIQISGVSTEVGPYDVLCGRGKESFNHIGNKRFRETITNSLDGYNRSETRVEKSLVILSIFDGIRMRGGRFLKKDDSTGQWYELSDQQTKEKIAHAVRDAANSTEARRHGKKPSSSSRKGGKSDEDGNSATGSPIPGGHYNLYPSLAAGASQQGSSLQFLSGMHTQQLPQGSESVFYQNLEAATRDIRSRGGDLYNDVSSAMPLVRPAPGFNNPHLHPFGGGSHILDVAAVMRDNAIPNTGMIGAAALMGQQQELPVAFNSVVALAQNTQPSFGQTQLQFPVGVRGMSLDPSQGRQDLLLGSMGPRQQQLHISPSVASVQRLVAGLDPTEPRQRSPDDPFLEQINDVLGPLSNDDHPRSDNFGGLFSQINLGPHASNEGGVADAEKTSRKARTE